MAKIFEGLTPMGVAVIIFVIIVIFFGCGSFAVFSAVTNNSAIIPPTRHVTPQENIMTQKPTNIEGYWEIPLYSDIFFLSVSYDGIIRKNHDKGTFSIISSKYDINGDISINGDWERINNTHYKFTYTSIIRSISESYTPKNSPYDIVWIDTNTDTLHLDNSNMSVVVVSLNRVYDFKFINGEYTRFG